MTTVLTVGNPSEGGSGGGKLTTPGDYVCIAESLIRKTGPKADYFSVCFRVIARVGGDGSTFDPSCAGSFFYEVLSLSQKALWRVGKLAYFAGHDSGTTVDLDNQDSTEDFLCDRECVIGVEVGDDGRGYGPRASWTGDGRRLTGNEKKSIGAVYDSRGEPYNEAWRPERDDSWGGKSNGKTSQAASESPEASESPAVTDVPF